MTAGEVVAAARDLYNATSDSFFADTQMYNWVWQGCQEFAKKAWTIESTSTQSTVVGTQDYVYPTNCIAVKRVLYNGKKLKRLTHRQDDAATLSNQNSTQSGTPVYYTDFNLTLSLRPIPDAVSTLKVYGYFAPTTITTAAAVLQIPALFHFDLVDYLLSRMYSKDKQWDAVSFYQGEWGRHLKDAVAHKARVKRSDSFATVQDEETLPVTIFGEV